MFSCIVLKFSALPSCYLWQEQLRLWRLFGGGWGGNVYSLFFCPRLLLSLPSVFYLEADQWHSVNLFWGEGSWWLQGDSCLFSSLLSHRLPADVSDKGADPWVHWELSSLCLYRFTVYIPLCAQVQMLPLLPCGIACAICREACKRWVYFLPPLSCVPPVKTVLFFWPTFLPWIVRRFMHAFPVVQECSSLQVCSP